MDLGKFIRISLASVLLFSAGCILYRPPHFRVSFLNGTESEVLIRSLSEENAVWRNLEPSSKIVFDGTYDVELMVNGEVSLFRLFSGPSIPFYEQSNKNIAYFSNRNGCYFFMLAKNQEVYFRYVRFFRQTGTTRPIFLKNLEEIEETQPDGFPLRGEKEKEVIAPRSAR